MSTEDIVVVTKEEQTISNKLIRLEALSLCNHEEDDFRIFILYMLFMLQGNR